tara:strand:+ start:754 stop:993 length:240 start_codon:yes stop_codon:yes gene_type:complete
MNINLRNQHWDSSDAIPSSTLQSRMRKHRNRLLADSDWSQAEDNQISNKAEWTTYRQQLRDFPATWTPAETVDLPDAPA